MKRDTSGRHSLQYLCWRKHRLVKQTAQEDFLLTSIIHFERYYFTPEYKKLNNVSREYDRVNG